MKATELKRGDACPACHGELKPAYVPTDDELRKASDRENPIALIAGADTATKDQRDELGELFVCDNCGYRTRFAAEGGNGKGSSGDRSSDAARGGGAGDTDRGGDSESGESGARSGASSATNRRR